MLSQLPEKSGYLFKETKKKILLVEDAESIVLAINDYLSRDFQVSFTTTIKDAQNVIEQSIKENNPFDLLVTDINLPDSTGFDLIRFAKKHSPSTKIALITSYEINDYIEIILRESIEQVITKHSLMSLHDIYVMAQKILSQDIFGIEKYFPDIRVFYPLEMNNGVIPGNKEIFSITVKSSADKLYWMNKISEILYQEKNISIATSRLILDEMLANAMIRAPRHKDGTHKYQRRKEKKPDMIPMENIVLQPEDYVIIQYGFYNEWVIINCQDPHGTLCKHEILYRLCRHIALDPLSSLPQGISDSHGRGIFLLREHLTNIIFNIHKGRKTEILGLLHTGQDLPYKNISIYEKY